MKVNNDTKEKIKTFGLMFLQSYKILMGSMISIFVPQKCEIIDNLNNKTNYEICSIESNIKNEKFYHQLALVLNCLTTLGFIYLFFVEYRREHWLIKKLDIDHNKADNNLDTILLNRPKLKNKLYKINNNYFYTTLVLFLLFVANNIASIKIINTNNYGSATLNSYLSFEILIALKLYNSFEVSYFSKRNHKAFSAFLREFSSFNVIDPDYLVKEEIEMTTIIRL
tara:strand:- start:716 stop:1390 length:675 start_codon:yes stop_codon:yes gene_type:complete